MDWVMKRRGVSFRHAVELLRERPGGRVPDEATYYVIEFGKAWKDTPGAIAWLIDKTGPAAPKRLPAKIGATKP